MTGKSGGIDMVPYYKVVADGFIVGVGTNGPDSANAISKTTYNKIIKLYKSKPEHDDTFDWWLTEQYEWVRVEYPEPEPEET